MNTAQPGATATIMAFHRAMEMLYSEAERVCHDPLAVLLLPPAWAELLHNREQLSALMGEKAKLFPGVNGAIAVRPDHVRYIAMDFAKDSIKARLMGNGFDPEKKEPFYFGGAGALYLRRSTCRVAGLHGCMPWWEKGSGFRFFAPVGN